MPQISVPQFVAASESHEAAAGVAALSIELKTEGVHNAGSPTSLAVNARKQYQASKYLKTLKHYTSPGI